ncbi:MAG: aminoacyl-tRNA hydrolase [Actinomycetes bacterium]|nr:aminoacyl-tRNA hydrolase [Acidimicrobiia bacterium]HZI37329.1 aminoacyl-tRNA hydrolase [Acidimicrobiia bacterium]
MKAIVGLRNPGPEYSGTRHNLGFEVVEAVADRLGERLKRGPSRVRCEIAETRVDGEKLVLAAPLSYMNESGGPVRALADYFDVDTRRDLLVVHDDIDLPFGKLRMQVGGGTAGHNGLRSIERALGHRDFHRLKAGVGRPPGRMDPAEFVLRRFTSAERAEIDLLVVDAAEAALAWVGDLEKATQMAGQRRPA